jgi:hypothetical protein
MREAMKEYNENAKNSGIKTIMNLLKTLPANRYFLSAFTYSVSIY